MLAVLVFPLWLALWAGRAIHDRWGMRGLWIYVGALIMSAALHPMIAPPTPPPPAPLYPVVVITVTSTVNP